ncbi:L-ribulose-5-phosphate 4-epimerase AraD [Candidatus Sumerlaeota bacterium]|nr:L-ribulose-5-phosphate 4-epimerase AraD [Candidatus Sumerlaeota bacterium]
MAHDALKREVCRVNKEIVKAGLVTLTWGNASGVDRDAGVLAIKPSGVDYDQLAPDDIVVLSLASGEILEGTLKPSSDTPTHLYLAQKFPESNGIVHTHSTCATSFCQAGMKLPCLGTTHADHFFGTVPCVRALTEDEVREAYEHNTGVAIVEAFEELGIDPAQVPAVLQNGHAPFAWGATPAKALENAIVLEECARMALMTWQLNPKAELPRHILDKHFLRKHGPGAYYGQKN